MDGTLWDPAEQIATAWTGVIRHFSNPDRTEVSAEEVRSIMGMTMTDVALNLFPASDPSLRDEIMEECMDQENQYLEKHGGVLYEGLEDTLLQLGSDGWPLYIVSNCQSGYIEAFLTYYHFEPYFQDIECFGNTGLPKSGSIRRLVERCRLDRYYYVGDIQADYDATVEAGGLFIHAAYGLGTVREEVPELKRITDLPQLMKDLSVH